MWKNIGVVFAVLAVVACESEVTEPPPQEFEWHGSFQAEAGWEHLSGEATVQWAEFWDQTFVVATIEGDEFGAIRPWQLGEGTCAQPSVVVGSEESYPPLVVGAEGDATVTTAVPVVMDPEAVLHVTVHDTLDDESTVLLCADLTRQ